MTRPPLPPFDVASATLKVRAEENRRNLVTVALAYTPDSRWRNRAEFVTGRAEIESFLTRKWARELDYRLIKELWAVTGDRIAVRCVYEWHDADRQWFRLHGNENWRFDVDGYMAERHARINELAITDAERKFRWDAEVRPSEHPGLSELGL